MYKTYNEENGGDPKSSRGAYGTKNVWQFCVGEKQDEK